MNTFTKKIAIFFFITLLAGCAKLADMVNQYTLSESMLNNYMQRHLGETKTINTSGLANANISFENLKADIGREDAKKLTLSGNAKFALSSILGSQSADLTLKMKARPVYDSAKGAVYLKDLEISDYKLDSTLGFVGASALLPYVNQALQFYFNQQPVYTLSASNSALEAVVLKIGTNIEVRRGQLIFPLGTSALLNK